MSQYTHLHNHTSLSLFDGAQTPGALARRAEELGMSAAAITDHGACYGWPSFQKACEEVGIKPILGIEAYLVEDFDWVQELREKGGKCTDEEKEVRKTRFHQVLLAKTQEGLTNIMKLASWAADEGFYHEPTIDFKRLRQHSEGVIATSSCVQGLLPQLALAGDPFGRWSKQERMGKAHSVTETYLDIFGGDFYLEAHRHGIEDEETMNDLVQYLAGKYDIPVITANDCHYAREEDYRAQKAKTCISTSKPGNPTCFGDPEAGKYAHENMHIKSAEEMVGLFEEFPRAAENTMRIAEQCDARLPMGKDKQFFPEFPGLGPAQTAHERLIQECKAGFRRRCPNAPQEYQKRLRHELKVIGEMGFDDYFLIVADIVRYARQESIRVGPGRGSAAGSLVAYVLGITELDPVQHGLLFERFLNPARTTMPDIDIDFDDARREEVFRYIRQKYGERRVARVITFDRYGLRSSVRNLGRIFGLEPTTRDEIAGHLGDLSEKPDTVAEATEQSGPLGRMRREDERFAKVCELVPKIKGLARHASQHPAAVVITPEEISSHVPTKRNNTERSGTERNGGETVTQFDGDQLEDIGLLKMDVLGLKTLREIDVAMDIADGLGQKVSEEALKARNDPEVYADVFAAGDTQGIFQFASDGMQEALAEMEPSAFEHIVAMNALYRPGPMKLIPQFIARMHGKEETVYLAESVHDAVKGEVGDILSRTYGIMVYQEQVMQVAQRLAGFSLEEADVMRRAISKKKASLLTEQKESFVAGCQEEGYSEQLGETVFGLIEDFAGYALNKAHSASYSALAYQQAYFKCYYPTAFYAAALRVEEDPEERADLVCGAKRNGIAVRRPSINESKRRFSAPEAGSIRFGLSTIKDVGEEAETFVEERERNGRFSSFLGCLTRCVPNARAVKALVKAGAFDEFGLSRAAMHSQAGEVLSYVRKHQDSCPASQRKDCSENCSGNQSGNPQAENCQDRPKPPAVEDRPEWPPTKRFRAEREVVGIYTTGQPIDTFPGLVELYDGETWRRNHPRYGASDFKVRCCSILSVSEATTRTGDAMWWLRFMTRDGITEEPIFKWRYEHIRNNLETDVAALIVSKADAQGEYEGMYSIQNVVPMDDLEGRSRAGASKAA